MPLKRTLGFFSLTFYGVGIILGAGIYALIGKAAGIAGYHIWISMFLSVFLAAFTGLSYAELSSAFPKAGAESTYVLMASKSKLLSFIVGWLIAVAGILAATTVSLAFAGYLTEFIKFDLLLVAAIVLAVLSLINFLGIDLSTKINIFCSIVEMLGIIIIIILGFPLIFNSAHNFFDFTSINFNNIINATALIFFAFIGFEAIAKLSEETIDAKNVVPKALIASIVITSILYVLLALSALSVLEPTQIASTNAPLALVALHLGGKTLAVILAVFALFSTFNTILVSLIVTSRLIYGMAENKELPLIFSKINKKTLTPFFSIAFVFIASFLLLFAGSIKEVAEATNFTTFIAFLAVNLSVIILRYDKHFKPRFKMPLNIGNFPLLAFFGALTSFLMLLVYSFFVAAITLVFIFIGLIFYFLAPKEKTRKKRFEYPKN